MSPTENQSSKFCFLLCVGALFAICTATPAGAKDSEKVPFLDQIEYREQLRKQRPDIKDWPRCKKDIKVRSSLRPKILELKQDYESLVSGSYSEGLEEIDSAWVRSHISAIEKERSQIQLKLAEKGVHGSPWQDERIRTKLEQFQFYPDFNNPKIYVGFKIGPIDMHWYEPDGFIYKIFFEFREPEKDLAPDKYTEFAKKLSQAGFIGHSKIPVGFGLARFNYNNLIIHASTIKMALTAEQIGLSFFEGKLSGISRGVDVRNKMTKNRREDWNRFLCESNVIDLPNSVRQFVKNQNH